MIPLILVSIIGLTLAVIAILIFSAKQAERDASKTAKLLTMADDIALAHAEMIEYATKFMSQVKHIEDNSSFSGSKLALLEARLNTIEKILVESAPVLYPYTVSYSTETTSSTAKSHEEGKKSDKFQKIEAERHAMFNKLPEDHPLKRALPKNFNPWDEGNRRG